MSQQQPSQNAATTSAQEEALYFNTVTLSRFMRANYGDEAIKVTRERIAAYTRGGHPDIAEIWQRVLAHLTGIELKEDHRRRLKPLGQR